MKTRSICVLTTINVIYRENPDGSIEVYLDIVSLESAKTFKEGLFIADVTDVITKKLTAGVLNNIPVVKNYLVVKAPRFGNDLFAVMNIYIYFSFFWCI